MRAVGVVWDMDGVVVANKWMGGWKDGWIDELKKLKGRTKIALYATANSKTAKQQNNKTTKQQNSTVTISSFRLSSRRAGRRWRGCSAAAPAPVGER